MAEQRSIEIPELITDDVRFHYHFGVFHSMWGTIEILVDMAIGEFLGLVDTDAITVTWGMMFGAKAKLLKALIKRSDHPRKGALGRSLGSIWKD